MAKYVIPNPVNPDILGVSIEDAAIVGVGGVGLTAVVTDRFVSPLVRGVIPGATGASMLGKLVDAGATVVAGAISGMGIGLVWPRAKNLIYYGAVVLSMGKVVAAFLPGYSPLGPLPIPTSFGLGGTEQPKQIAAGIKLGSVNGAAQQVPISGQTVALGVGSTGL